MEEAPALLYINKTRLAFYVAQRLYCDFFNTKRHLPDRIRFNAIYHMLHNPNYHAIAEAN